VGEGVDDSNAAQNSNIKGGKKKNTAVYVHKRKIKRALPQELLSSP